MIDKKYLLVTLIAVSFLIICPFLKYILFSFVLAGIVYPLYQKVQSKTHSKRAAAMISTVFILVVFAFSVYAIISNLFSEFATISVSIDSQQFLNNKYIQILLPHILGAIAKYASDLVQNLFKDLVGYVISIFLTYYVLVHIKDVENFVLSLGFIEESELEKAVSKFYGIVVGNILLWLIQAFLSYIGFSLLGLETALILSILVFVFSALPILGPWTVWLPIFIYFAWKGYIFLAAITFVYGILVITVLAEVVVKPLLVGKTSTINPAIVLVGILGGLYLLGFPGIFLGPLFLEYAKDYLTSYFNSKEKGENKF